MGQERLKQEESPMEQRRNQIVELVNRKGSISFAQLKEAFPFVSEMTLRTDLKALDEARRVKENYLALLTKLEFQQKDGQLIEMAAAEEVLFNAFRQQRDSWLNWPSRVAPLMAADLGVPADRMTEVLIEHVHKHISVLGEPEFNPAED